MKQSQYRTTTPQTTEKPGDTTKNSWAPLSPHHATEQHCVGEVNSGKDNTANTQNITQKHYKLEPVYHQKKTFFLISLCFEIQHLPRNNGRHLPNNSHPPKKKGPTIARSHPPAPPPEPTAEPDWRKAGRERGRCDGAKGWEEGGRSGDGQRADAKTTGVGKL